MINNYFIKREQIIANFDIVVIQQIEKKKIDDSFGILKGSLFFENGY